MIFAGLKTIEKGRKIEPPRILVYGPHGVGKTTFAASCPAPILLQAEGGIGELEIDRFPVAKSYREIVDALETLRDEDHEYRTVIIDSLDWLERLIWTQLCSDQKKDSIEAFGYGKGYTMALKYWETIIALLDDLRSRKRMMSCLIAHSQVKAYADPTDEPYDRYMIDMHKSASAYVCEWSDAVLFLSYRMSTLKTDKGTRRGVGDGQRVLYTEERPAWIAKSRYSFPAEIEVGKDGWNSIKKYLRPPRKTESKILDIATATETEIDELEKQAKEAKEIK